MLIGGVLHNFANRFGDKLTGPGNVESLNGPFTTDENGIPMRDT